MNAKPSYSEARVGMGGEKCRGSEILQLSKKRNHYDSSPALNWPRAFFSKLLLRRESQIRFMSVIYTDPFLFWDISNCYDGAGNVQERLWVKSKDLDRD